MAVILAHGGALGAAFEIGFVLVPIIVFTILARASKRRLRQEQEDEDISGGDEQP